MRPTAGRAGFAASLTVGLVAASGAGAYRGPERLPPLSAPVLRTVGVGRDPVALAVDARTGRVFVLGAAGSVTTLDATTGSVIRTVAVGRGAQAVAVDEATGRAFVTDPGRVFVLDARSGATLRALPLGGGPTGELAVDARHGEVFVPANGAPRPVERGGLRAGGLRRARRGDGAPAASPPPIRRPVRAGRRGAAPDPAVRVRGYSGGRRPVRGYP